MNRTCVVLAALVTSIAMAHADEPPLTTDRPDQSDSPFVVPQGLFQIEAGVRYGERSCCGQDLDILALPSALVRYGITDTLELRLGLPSYSVEDSDTGTGSDTNRGFGDTTLGFKAKLAEQQGHVPDIAFVGTMTVPTGDSSFSSDEMDPGFRFSVGRSINPRVSLTSNVGMLWTTAPDSSGDKDTRSFFDWTAVAAYTINDRLGGFTELFGLTGISADSPTLTSLGTGVTYLLRPRVQLDSRVTAGLSRHALDWTVEAGVSYRFPR